MSKFGTLIQSETPVLIDFYSNQEKQNNDAINRVNEVALAVGDTAKIIRIDVAKNEILAKALRIKYMPTFIIYKENEMKWRQSGQVAVGELIEMIEKFV